MITQFSSNTLKKIIFALLIIIILSCNSSSNNKNQHNNNPTTVLLDSEHTDSIPNSIVRFLITSATNDFFNHQPPLPVDFRDIKVGILESDNNDSVYILCGEFLSKAKEESGEWEKFATIKTSGYEQYTGSLAESYCQKAIMVSTNITDLANELKTEMIKLTTHKPAIQNKPNTHKDSLNKIVKDYYRLNLKVFQSGSTVEDIDAIFNLFTEDFVYIHPKYGGTYTRENLYNGYVRNQKNGGYNGNVVDIKVENKIIGLNAVVTEKRYIEKNKAGDLEMTLFEFREGKISKIFEYW